MRSQSPEFPGNPLTVAAVVGGFSLALGLVLCASGTATNLRPSRRNRGMPRSSSSVFSEALTAGCVLCRFRAAWLIEPDFMISRKTVSCCKFTANIHP